SKSTSVWKTSKRTTFGAATAKAHPNPAIYRPLPEQRRKGYDPPGDSRAAGGEVRAVHHGMDRRTFMALATGAAGALALPGLAHASGSSPAPLPELPPGLTPSGLAGRGGRTVVVGHDAAGAASTWWSDGGAWQPATSPPPADALLG